MSETPSEAVLARRALLVEGDLRKALWRLAWPAILSAGLTAGFGIADTLVVGHLLGAPSLAALATGAFLLWSVDALALGGAVGVTALVARRVGEENAADAAHVTRQGVSLALGMGLVVAALAAPFAALPFELMSVTPEVASIGAPYLRVIFIGSAAIFLLQVLLAALRGTGDTTTPLLLLGAALVANVAISVALVGGFGPAPRLGVTGAAWATILSHLLAAAVALVLLARQGVLDGARSLTRWRPRLEAWRRILAIGSPAAANMAFFCLVYVVLARITAEHGTAALAALGVGHKGEAPCYFLAVGVAAAVAPLVGQSLGAGRLDRASRVAWLGLRQAALFALPWTLLLVAAPGVVARAFTDEPEVVAVASRYLIIVGATQVLLAAEVVFDGAFAGAGDTVPPLLIGLPMSAARVPLAWLLGGPLGLGADGIWLAISGTTVVKAVLLALWWRRGRWARRAREKGSACEKGSDPFSSPRSGVQEKGSDPFSP